MGKQNCFLMAKQCHNNVEPLVLMALLATALILLASFVGAAVLTQSGDET